ncbi:hypothetical protein GCK32_021396 [Trichostrongylus colubriformis]|uniref:Uncharacterized protein n=1 Tax=Trichostrongylus colubriformis TaxID=6319 RepID=A0AAN8F9C8_TRICO
MVVEKRSVFGLFSLTFSRLKKLLLLIGITMAALLSAYLRAPFGRCASIVSVIKYFHIGNPLRFGMLGSRENDFSSHYQKNTRRVLYPFVMLMRKK